MSFPSPPVSVALRKYGNFTEKVNEEFLKVTGASSLPAQAKVEALTEAYFKYLYHRTPVVDRADLRVEQPSILLSQALCLIGTLLRHPKGSPVLAASEEFYVKTKTLLYVNHEKDSLTTLKALCLIGCWNVTPPLVMGLHRETTYSKLPNPGTARRIAWYIFAQDKLQAACFGRPAIIKSGDFDVRPLELRDFEAASEQAEIFIEYTKLCVLLGRMVDLQTQKPETSSDAAVSILESLKVWINEFPENLRLYNKSGSRIYRRDVYEVHIGYFVTVIMFFHLCGHAIRSSAGSLASLMASSCIARLYEEMDWRDDLNYLLPINNWFVMVACVPQIHHGAGLHDQDDLCTEDLDILMTVLKQLGIKWPPANSILNTVDRLRKSKNDAATNISQSLGPRGDSADNDYLAVSSQPAAAALHELFPFPRSMCPRMSLLDHCVKEHGNSTTRVATPPNEETWDWIFDEFNPDFFEMPFESLPPQLTVSEPMVH